MADEEMQPQAAPVQVQEQAPAPASQPAVEAVATGAGVSPSVSVSQTAVKPEVKPVVTAEPITPLQQDLIALFQSADMRICTKQPAKEPAYPYMVIGKENDMSRELEKHKWAIDLWQFHTYINVCVYTKYGTGASNKPLVVALLKKLAGREVAYNQYKLIYHSTRSIKEEEIGEIQKTSFTIEFYFSK